MSNSDPFLNIYPDVLENSAAELGDLIGQTLTLQDISNRQGSRQEVFTAPRQKFVMAAFDIKKGEGDPVYLFFDLDLAIELAGQLIMLPADEINAHKKKKELDGDLLDAFSEIANILSGVINAVLQEAFPDRKMHFVKGKLDIFPAKSANVPLSDGIMTAYSAKVTVKDSSPGGFTFFFPHSLLSEGDVGVKALEDELSSETGSPTPELSVQGKTEKTKPENTGGPSADATPASRDMKKQPPVDARPDNPDDALFQEISPDMTEDPEPLPLILDVAKQDYMDQGFVDTFLLEGLETAREEFEALLGYPVTFVGQQTLWKTKKELLSRTKGKQVLTRVKVSGDKDGYGYVLIPLKDAVHFGGLLLMMPSESIAESIKKGEFDGEVADAFGEIVNILVGSYSNQFKNEFPVKISLKKESLEVFVPIKGDLPGDQPFPDDDFYLMSAGIRMGDQPYGPIELFFPAHILGVQPPPGFESAEIPGHVPGNEDVWDLPAFMSEDQSLESQKVVPGYKGGQKIDSALHEVHQHAGARIITIIGEDADELAGMEEIIRDAGFQYRSLMLDEDLKSGLAGEDTCVFLFINKVNDQGLARAIKIKSVMGKNCPLVLAGPQWTRSSVIKARRYGADDILVTPADTDSIRKKCRKYT